MRLLIQRVTRASVTIGGNMHSQIGQGLLILAGVENDDTPEDVEWLVGKTAKLRIFADQEGIMNLDATQIGSSFLVVSQFTLHASTKKGNRPSYIRAAGEQIARPMYELFARRLAEVTGLKVETGVFGADMQVELINDGPVTIWIDSKNRE